MKNRVNYAFLAFLAWMAALMVVVMMQGCTTYDGTDSFYYEDDGTLRKQRGTNCACYQ